jgi:PAS domain S-box-containing protein
MEMLATDASSCVDMARDGSSTGLTPVSEAHRRLLEEIVLQAPVGLIAVDAEGRPVLLNAAAREFVGERRDSTLDDADWRPVPGAEADGAGPLTRALLFGVVVSSERFALAQPDGSAAFVEVSATPVRDESGAIVGAVATLVDLTRRESQERAQRDFITNAAHELQSPLAAIVSAVEVLQRGAKDSDERDLFLGHVEREAGRLTHLVRALLTLARAQTGAEPPKTEVVALGPIFRELAADLRLGPAVELTVTCADELAVVGNVDLIRHVVHNLARNAAKFTSSGSITIECKAVDGAVEIAVADTGRGIPAEDHDRVFERFYRGGAGEGFGLGLTIARAVADILGGDLRLESEEGVGTTVRLRLPAAASLVTE